MVSQRIKDTFRVMLGLSMLLVGFGIFLSYLELLQSPEGFNFINWSWFIIGMGLVFFGVAVIFPPKDLDFTCIKFRNHNAPKSQ